MSRQLELPDDLCARLELAAQQAGTTLVGWLDSYLPPPACPVPTQPQQEVKTMADVSTEATHLLGRFYVQAAQEDLWGLLMGHLALAPVDDAGLRRMRQLRQRYHDVPMDFADASLVVATKRLDESRIFTFDSHFRAELTHDRHPFQIVP